MPFPELEQYKRRDPEVSALLTSLELYLDELLNKPPRDPQSFYKHPAHDINPFWVAKRLDISVQRAYALLYLCLTAGLITPRYDVYCPETMTFIQSFYSPDDLPQQISCPHHEGETEHTLEEAAVMLLFQFAPYVVQGDYKIAV
jgi:hypothetical protein